MNNDTDSEVIQPIETDMLFVFEEQQKPRDPSNNDTEEVFYIKDDSVDPIRDVGDHIKSCINGKISIQVELEYDSKITGSGRISKDYRERAERVYKAMEVYYGLWDE